MKIQYDEKTDELIYSKLGRSFERADWLRLAIAALDQADIEDRVGRLSLIALVRDQFGEEQRLSPHHVLHKGVVVLKPEVVKEAGAGPDEINCNKCERVVEKKYAEHGLCIECENEVSELNDERGGKDVSGM